MKKDDIEVIGGDAVPYVRKRPQMFLGTMPSKSIECAHLIVAEALVTGAFVIG